MEKWLQSKATRRIVQRARPSSFSKRVAARFGTPVQLFKDSDKDGVMNVFDCQPHNKRKQDVMQPQNFGGGGVGDMLARQESLRQVKAYQAEYNKMIAEAQKQEEARIAALNAEGYEVTDRTDFTKYNPETLSIASGKYIGGKGFVTTTGQTYPTTNKNWVPTGYKIEGSYSPAKGGFVTKDGKLYPSSNKDWVPTKLITIPNPNFRGLTAAEIKANSASGSFGKTSKGTGFTTSNGIFYPTTNSSWAPSKSSVATATAQRASGGKK